MYSLTDLKEYLEQQSQEIFLFNGMFLYTIHGKWGMYMNKYCLNGKEISRKQIKAIFENVKNV